MSGASSQRRFNKEANKTEAARLYWKEHLNQYEIAEILGVDRSTVTYYLKEVGEEWKKERLELMDTVFERELLELDAMEANATKCLNKFGDAIDAEGNIIDETYLNSKEAIEWTKARLKIKELKGKMLGFNSPQKVQHSGEVSINLTVADCGEDEVEDLLPEDD
jgi:predicted DNA-binding protein (UPF0251 family)